MINFNQVDPRDQFIFYDRFRGEVVIHKGNIGDIMRISYDQ